MLRTALFAATPIALAAAGVAQSPTQNAPVAKSAWVAPGTAGSPIDGDAFHAQVLLDAAGFSPGVIDGKNGMSMKNALRGFQKSRGLKESGALDTATRQALLSQNRQSTIMVKLSPEQVAGPFVYPFPKKPEDQAKLQAMGYRNMLEKVAEDFHTTPDTIVALNGPTAMIGAGHTLKLPNVVPTNMDYQGKLKDEHKALMHGMNINADATKGSHIIVDKSEGLLKVLDDKEKLIAQFPVTTGSGHDPLPLGNWKVTTYAFLPPFHYQPDLFWDVDDGKEEQKLPAGPNGPVGVAWLDLTKEHYGIHGTPEPSTIGRTQSHGCIRMTNWDVLRLSQMMKPGFKAEFVA